MLESWLHGVAGDDGYAILSDQMRKFNFVALVQDFFYCMHHGALNNRQFFFLLFVSRLSSGNWAFFVCVCILDPAPAHSIIIIVILSVIFLVVVAAAAAVGSGWCLARQVNTRFVYFCYVHTKGWQINDKRNYH